MFERLKQFGIVSRAEFILPNLGSLILGLAWGATRTSDLAGLIIILVLSFSIINLSSAIGAQINTYYDYELDMKDDRKKQLVLAEESFGRDRLKLAFISEFFCALVLVCLFTVIQGKPILLILWVLGIFLGCGLFCDASQAESSVMAGTGFAFSCSRSVSSSVCILLFHVISLNLCFSCL